MTRKVMKLEKEKSYSERTKVLASSESPTPGPGGGSKKDWAGAMRRRPTGEAADC